MGDLAKNMQRLVVRSGDAAATASWQEDLWREDS